MAKQSFVSGQVLLASQLTSLQQTAMNGGAASNKTASYTLVSSDAGTAISMTSTSATTITVNTGIFSDGDTVLIQNLGSGNCTITAGTATVNTAGSLILPQYDAGILKFVSSSSAVFYDFIQVGATSPLTTKGDLYGFSSSDARIPIGANGTVLTADSTESLGLKWATPASGGMTLISTTTLTGASVTLSSIPQTYKSLYYVIRDFLPATDDMDMIMRFNGDSNGSRHKRINALSQNNVSFDASFVIVAPNNDNSVAGGLVTGTIPDYTNTTTRKMGTTSGQSTHAVTTTNFDYITWYYFYKQTDAVTSLYFAPTSGDFISGTLLLYGVS